MVRKAFPDLRFSEDVVLSDGEFVCGRWTMTGTHTGVMDLFRLPPTGRPVAMTGQEIFRVGRRTDRRRRGCLHTLQEDVAGSRPPSPRYGALPATQASDPSPKACRLNLGKGHRESFYPLGECDEAYRFCFFPNVQLQCGPFFAPKDVLTTCRLVRLYQCPSRPGRSAATAGRLRGGVGCVLARLRCRRQDRAGVVHSRHGDRHGAVLQPRRRADNAH
jgi:hypothetical protein